MTLDIGGHHIALTGEETLGRVAELPGMKPFLTDHAECDMHIVLDARLPIPEVRTLHTFDIADGAQMCRFGVDAEGALHFLFDGEGHVRFDGRSRSTATLSAFDDPSTLSFALWAAYALMGLGVGSLPMHASTVVHGGMAVLCLGESGTGKSTHTALWLRHIAGSSLLNDDSPIVTLADGEALAYGSPWSGKTPCHIPSSHPVAAFVRIVRGKKNEMVRMSALEAVAALLPSCPPALAHDTDCMDRMVDFVGRIIATTPVYRLRCLPDADAATLCHKTIYGS